jgi:hypothetical protein
MDHVIVVVNGEEISERELDSSVSRYIVQLEEDEEAKFEPNETNLKYIKAEVLNHLVEKHLLLQKAKSDGVEIPHEAVARNIEMMRSNFQTDEEWKDNMTALRIPEEDFFDEIQKDMMLEKFLNQHYQKNIQFSEQQLKDYYRDNERFMKEPDLFSFFEGYAVNAEKVKFIYEELKQHDDAEEIEKQLKHLGIDFHSHVDIPAYQLPEPVVNVLSELQPLEVASMQADGGGMLVYKLIRRAVGNKLDYEQIKEKLSEYLISSAKSEVADTLIREEMEKAKIEYKDVTYLEKK